MDMHESLLQFRNVEEGIQEVSLNITELYTSPRERERFEERLRQFLGSDPAHSEIFARNGDILVYRTEQIIPEKQDLRPLLVLLLGNPASHSVASGMFFAFERDRVEHRFWKVLKETNFLSFASDFEPIPLANVDDVDVEQRNQLRKRELYELCYSSPFRVGLAVFYSMPSPASGSEWAGVAGLNRLFRKEALLRISECEKSRIEGLIGQFVAPKGAVVAFQKDAYLGIKSSASPDYKLAEVKDGKLLGHCECDPRVKLLCCPPTRLIRKSVSVLGTFKEVILKNS